MSLEDEIQGLKETVARWRMLGLEVLVQQRGLQTGFSSTRLGPWGLQISGADTNRQAGMTVLGGATALKPYPGIYLNGSFSPSPTGSYPFTALYGNSAGTGSNLFQYNSAAVFAGVNQSTSATKAEVDVVASVSGGGANDLTLMVVADSVDGYTYVFSSAFPAVASVRLPYIASDPVSINALQDSAIWYRSDINRFRVRQNGVTRNLVTDDTTADDLTQYTKKATLTTTGDLYYASAASTPARLALSVPAANVLNALAVANGETVPSWKPLLDATGPADVAEAAVAGTSLITAHRDHVHAGTSYLLLNGRAGGQTAIGGTAAGNGLTIKSTSNATKGKVTFGNAGSHAYDEVNERWGFGTASPSQLVHITAGELLIDGTITTPAIVSNPTRTNNGASATLFNLTGTLNGSGTNATGIYFGSTFAPSATIAASYGFRNLPTLAPPAGVTITTAYGMQNATLTGSDAGSITTLHNAYFNAGYGSQKPGTVYGLTVDDIGAAGITTAVALHLTLPTGATNKYYMDFNTANTAAAGAYVGKLPILVNGTLQYIHYFN